MILKLISVGILTLVYLVDDGFADPDPHIRATLYQEFREDQSTVINRKGEKDPFQWLEKHTDETEEFIKYQRELTDAYLRESTYGAQIKATYKKLWQLEKFDGPFRKGQKFFSYRSRDADKQDILYVHDEAIAKDAEATVFLNVNKPDGSVTFHKAASAFSKDGQIFAYLTSVRGSNSNTLKFKHINDEDGITIKFNEELTEVKNSKVAWVWVENEDENKNKNAGIFYLSYRNTKKTKEEEKSDKLKLYYHEMQTDQENDINVMPQFISDLVELQDYRLSISTSDDYKYLILTLSKGDRDIVYVASLNDNNYRTALKNALKSKVMMDFNAKFEYVTNYGHEFIFRTNEGADNYKLVMVDVEKMSSKVLVPEDNKKVLQWAKPASRQYLVLGYIAQDITSVLQLHDSNIGSRVLTFELPYGAVKAESFYYDELQDDIYFKFESFFTPCIIYKFRITTPPMSIFRPEKVKVIELPDFDQSEYDAKLVKFQSRGADVPMYIASKKNIALYEGHFTFMTASGGFGESLLPYFSVNRIVVLKHLKGIHVVVNIRGGGEKGTDWHTDGYRLRKQNSMYDFQAAARFLIDTGYTYPELLAADGGGSGNSGPLIGASLNQARYLFKVVIAEAGLMDMLRFNQFAGGKYLVSEYGSPDNDEDYENLKRYSPLHNVLIDETDERQQQYPATMVVTSVHDNRNPSAHSLKFIATLQSEARKKPEIQENPLLLKIAESGKTSLEEAAEITSFIVKNIGIKFEYFEESPTDDENESPSDEVDLDSNDGKE